MQTGDQRGEIFLTRGNPVEEDNICATFFQPVLNRTRQAFAVLLFVMNNGNALRFNRLEDVFRRGWPLGGVQTGGTHNVLVAALGQLRVGGTGGNHQNTFVFVDIRRWLSG